MQDTQEVDGLLHLLEDECMGLGSAFYTSYSVPAKIFCSSVALCELAWLEQ